MNILIVGSGGREHALAWKLRQSPKVNQVFVAPGNAGTAAIATNIPYSQVDDILVWLKDNPVDLVIIGPDNYLAEGMVDTLQTLGIPAFGPTRAASEIEWSKAFAKKFMKEENIPTARYEIFTHLDSAIEYVKHQTFPIVIKASGLALGKGVVIAENLEQAKQTLNDIISNKIFGDAGSEVVIEEYLVGREISIHAFCDGETTQLFPSAQDHKRIGDGDMGPNTGGMGTVASLPWVTRELMKEIEDTVVLPTLAALKKRGREFKGILFPGIMITTHGPKVIEFNARFGDPETQVFMRLLESDLSDILLSCVNGTLAEQEITWSSQFATCIICASGGYPGPYEKCKEIHGLDANFHDDIVIFHSGTTLDKKRNAIVTDGGRVMGITAIAETLSQSLIKAYAAVDEISFEGMQFRKDIGRKSL
jgi:phosphoribosylamine--glycine ligase